MTNVPGQHCDPMSICTYDLKVPAKRGAKSKPGNRDAYLSFSICAIMNGVGHRDKAQLAG